MKKLLLIAFLVIATTANAQIRTDTIVKPIKITFEQTQWVKNTVTQVAIANIAAILILYPKYRYEPKVQAILTPLVLGSVIAFTYTKAIQYNCKKKLWKRRILY